MLSTRIHPYTLYNCMQQAMHSVHINLVSESRAHEYPISVQSPRNKYPLPANASSTTVEEVKGSFHHDKQRDQQSLSTSSQESHISTSSQDVQERMMSFPVSTQKDEATMSAPSQQEQATRYTFTLPRSQDTADKEITVVTQQMSQGSTVKDTTTKPHRQAQTSISVTTEDVLDCLRSSHSFLALEAAAVWLSLTYLGNSSGSPSLHTPSTCWLQVTGQGHGIMSILVLRGTCFTDNRLVVHSKAWNGLSYDCDPTAWVAPGVELTMKSKVANVSIEINDVRTLFRLHIHFKEIPQRRHGDLLEKRGVTRYLGTYSVSALNTVS